MKVSKISELKKAVAQIMSDVSNKKDFPKVITFNRGIEYPKYKVTVEEIEEDFFVDSKGTKWIKAGSHDQSNTDD
jgi:hypothetical protein